MAEITVHIHATKLISQVEQVKEAVIPWIRDIEPDAGRLFVDTLVVCLGNLTLEATSSPGIGKFDSVVEVSWPQGSVENAIVEAKLVAGID